MNSTQTTPLWKILAWTLGGLGLVLSLMFFSASLLISHISDSSKSSLKVFSKSGDIAIVEIQGVIMDSFEIEEILRDLQSDHDTKAVIIRLSSPGGAVGPSQEIFEAVKRLAAKKPVLCSMADLAASGAFYIAMGCPKIIANPGTLTGSIGVIMNFMNLKGLYQWAHVEPYIIKAGELKDIGSPNRAMTSQEEKLLKGVVDQVHLQFQEAVAKARKMSLTKVKTFADGRIFNGEEALKLGVIDGLGGEFEAIEQVKKMAGLKGEVNIVRPTRKKSKLESLLGEKSFFSKSDGDILSWLKKLPGLSRLDLKPGVAYFLPSFYALGESSQTTGKGHE